LDKTKTSKKNIQQDPIKVKKWKEDELERLKIKALKEGYQMYWHDESTLQLCANVVKTYAPKGETPILKLQDTKGYQYVCIASSISEKGDMFFQIRENSFKGQGIIDYLKALLARMEGKIMLIWDNAPWHASQEVKDFLNTDLGKRLWVAHIPPYSPELNPDELVWANLKTVQMPNRTAKNVKELKEMAQKAMENIKNNTDLVQSFFNKENYHFTN
jgi:transposase